MAVSMGGGPHRASGESAGVRLLTRREAIRLGLVGGAAAWLGRACQQAARPPEPPEPPSDAVYELTAESSLYDDFDGHGCFQTYDSRDLAVPGALAAGLWIPAAGARVVDSAIVPLPSGYGPDNVLEIGCGGLLMESVKLSNPVAVGFAEFDSFSADVMLSSKSTATRPVAAMNLHTSIPEQPPGKSWYCTLGIFKNMVGPGAVVVGQYGNVNREILEGDLLGTTDFDVWHNLRLGISTKADDLSLGEQDVRLEYYLDGTLMASRIPEDSAILLNPSRLGFGPYRELFVSRDRYEGQVFGYFNNIRGVYRDRIA
ncbi:MAG: hypothetical protein KA243_12340 [Candidatus Aminicenantes bacterium]|nr:hypothetical protein [Candidatus Aminicenantes bacterium]